MLYLRALAVAGLALLALFFSPGQTTEALPPPLPLFSVRDVGLSGGPPGLHDITPGVTGLPVPGLTCTAADLMTDPAAGLAFPCAARLPAAPAGPVPDAATTAGADFGLDIFGPFTDELDGISVGETLTPGVLDFDFSVDRAPLNGGATTAAGLSCGIPPADVTTEAAALEAQGDIFNTGTLAPVGCNAQVTDEAVLGLLAPNFFAPGLPPLDDMDALTEEIVGPGPGCTLTGGATGITTCPAMTIAFTPGGVLPAIPPGAFTFLAADEASILVPPATPAIPPDIPAGGCGFYAGGTPCMAVHSTFLGLLPGGPPLGDDIDALCWFDINGNGLPDHPFWTGLGPPGPGDMYAFSLTPTSASVTGGFYSAADILANTAFAGPPRILMPAAGLGLLPGDDVDALMCHSDDSDADGVPDMVDNCPYTANIAQADADTDNIGDACDSEGPSPNTNGAGGGDDCFDGADNDGDGTFDGGNCLLPPWTGFAPLFSTATIDATHDVTPMVNGGGLTCAAADYMLQTGFFGTGPCAPRDPPAVPGPVPGDLTFAPVDLGIDGAPGPHTPFADDIDATSFGETLGGPFEFNFSVDPAPANGGLSIGVPACGPAPNVGTEALALEAHGDIWNAGGFAPFGCNTQYYDEAALGLIAPNAGAPGAPPLDDIDALDDFVGAAGPFCTLVGGAAPVTCSAFSLTPGSAALAAIPIDTFTLSPADAASILVPPGTPASLTEPACPAGGTACIAVHSSVLTMLPGDDIDALCWWDVNGNGVPDVPSYALGPGITGDFYEFSFAPGSPSFPIFPGNVVYADGSGFFPPIITDVALGLAFMTDDVDALVCHDTDGDADGVPTAPDNCFAVFNPSQFDADLDGLGDACDTEGGVVGGNGNGVGGGDDCTDGVDNDGDGLTDEADSPACDKDFDGIPDPLDTEGPSPNADGLLGADDCDDAVDNDNDGLTDGFDSPCDSDGDTVADIIDNCPVTPNPLQSDADSDGFGDACDTEGPSPNVAGLLGADDCGDGVDNDGDGFTDGAELLCDVDGDGIADIADTEGPPGNGNGVGGADDCGDIVDNNLNGLADGLDPGCAVPPPVLYSVADLGTKGAPPGFWDITAALSLFPLSCASADLLTPPSTGPGGPCAARVLPAPPGPVPDAVTFGPIDLGLDTPLGFTPFFDDLNALSYGEPVNTGPIDYDFSVDAAPANFGSTVGLPACGAPPNVGTESLAAEAQGDIFNTGSAAPAGCNLQVSDEAILGLISPTAGAPIFTAPLDELDALTDISPGPPLPLGPCTIGGGGFAATCPAFSLTPTFLGGSLPVIPGDAFSGLVAADEGSILVPPGAPPSVTELGGCAPVFPCQYVGSITLGLVPGAGGDDIDALCWFDGNPNGVPDQPNAFIPGLGDYYIFSLTPLSPSVTAGFYSAADLLTPDPLAPGGPPLVLRTAGSLGLLAGDNVDALICRDDDTDVDGAPDQLDNCPGTINATQANTDGDQWGNACDNCPIVATPWFVPPGDGDCDAWTDAHEALITTDAGDACGFTAGLPTESETWPGDLVESNNINISDVLALRPVFGTAVPPTSARFDIVPGGGINISDVLSLKPVFGKSCTP